MINKRPPNYGDKEARRRKACERLGTDKPVCLLCDCSHPEILELHHPAQAQYHPETVVLCTNHHGLLSNEQKDHPAKIPGCVNQLEIVAHLLLGLSDMCAVAADELRDPGLANFLLYLRLKLKELALLLLEIARRNPILDMGITP